MDATYKTCKLALPLFFLVVRTNVGYSVVAEFIIQHEDTTSISEALSILRNKWDQLDIEVGNFMIDCQQSEENAIRAVFPDSVVYLCAFHRLQAWLRWIVNTKNGLSNYQTYCMGLLRAVGDAKTEDAYTKALMALQKSHVWSRYPNFRNYYSNQWAPKKEGKHNERVGVIDIYVSLLEEEKFFEIYLQMWVQAYRIGPATLRQHEQRD